MKANQKGFTLIELLAVIVILAVIALITTPIVLGIINDAKEASNLRSVEAYAKAVEYGVIQYEYKNNGELPTKYCQIAPYVSYTNTEVLCDVSISEDVANVKVEHCKVGSYTKNSYKYDGTLKTENRGAEKESTKSFSDGPDMSGC
ncbi:MAG: type II secretion system protein [Bacilli bacterium]|nr:type II secretion system protein [Bacilli bacterium]